MAPKQVRFSVANSPSPTRVCAYCRHRDLSTKSQTSRHAQRRSMHACAQCGAYECGWCVRFLNPTYCERCRICWVLTGSFPVDS